MTNPQLAKMLEWIQQLEMQIKDLPDNFKVKETDDISKHFHPEYTSLTKDELVRRIIELSKSIEMIQQLDGQKYEEEKSYMISEINDIELKLDYLIKYGVDINQRKKQFAIK